MKSSHPDLFGSIMETVLNPEAIATLQAMDEPGESTFMNQIIQVYSTDTRMRLDALRAAWVAKNTAEMGEFAHAVKGSSLNVGADRLAAMMQTIEREAKAGRLSDPIAMEAAEMEFKNVDEALRALLK